MKKRTQPVAGSDDDSEPEEQPMGKHRRLNVEEDSDEEADEISDMNGEETEGDEDEGEDGDSDGDEEDDTIEDQMADIPFEVLERLRQDGEGVSGKVARMVAKSADKSSFKRENKHRPMEMTSKKPVGRFRDVLQVANRKSRDPRFDDLSGKFHDDKFHKQYAFIYDEILPEERKTLKAKLAKEKNPKFKKRVQAQLQRLDQKLLVEKQRKMRSNVEQEWKEKQKKSASEGKQPYYLKASEKRKMELVAKYNELKSKNQLNKFMEKRRKKNAAKDHRYVPRNRREE